jgi:pyruvate dehydrogenase E1 component
MFGFQRTGDGIWAAADQLARGLPHRRHGGAHDADRRGPAAHGRALAGPGLDQPRGVHYDPAYGYEIAHIVQRRPASACTASTREDVIYYLTVYNEPIVQPAEPAGLDVAGLLKGMYLLKEGEVPEGSDPAQTPRAQLLASGVGVPWALEAQDLLRTDWGVIADVWSVTSWTQLRREAMACDEANFLDPQDSPRVPYVTQALMDRPGPVIATSDYATDVQDSIARWVPGDYAPLGADGFGFSDTRPAARRFFHIDGPSMVVRALQALAAQGKVDPQLPKAAAEKYRLLDVTAGSSGNEGGDS